VLFFNGGQSDGTPTDKYYIDDLRFTAFDPCDGVATNMDVVNDFDCQQNYPITCCITTFEIVDNPDVSGANNSAKVLKVTENGMNEYDALVFNRGEVIDLSTKNQLKFKILSTKAVPVMAKLEGGSSDKEVRIDITVVGEWTEYTVDFSDQAAANHKSLVFFFNVGQTDGTAADIYYIDDIEWE
jgi:hypothetical protein